MEQLKSTIRMKTLTLRVNNIQVMLVLIVLYTNILDWSIIRLLYEFLLFVFWLVLDIQELVEQEEKKEALCVVDLTGDKHDIVSDDSLLDDIIDITDEVWSLCCEYTMFE